MKIRLVSVIFLMLGISGCAGVAVKKIKPDQVGFTKTCNASMVGYTKSLFQARFASSAIAGQIFLGPLAGQAVWEASASYEKNSVDKSGNEFEKVLGDFDVASYFFNELESYKSNDGWAKIAISKNGSLNADILSAIRGSQISSFNTHDGCVGAIKLSYGLGARFGGEQFGFIKTYRPFILLVSEIRDSSSNAVMWRDMVLSFSEKAYRGNDADAKNLNRDTLVESFKEVSRVAVSEFYAKLNGTYNVKEPPELVDIAQSDIKM